MTYLTVKYIKGNPYLYEVRSVREGDRVIQKFVRYLGRADKEGKIERHPTVDREERVAREEVTPVAVTPTPEPVTPVTEAVEQPEPTPIEEESVSTPAIPKKYVIKEEPEPLYKSGKKYTAYYDTGEPRYVSAETPEALQERITQTEPEATFIQPEPTPVTLEEKPETSVAYYTPEDSARDLSKELTEMLSKEGVDIKVKFEPVDVFWLEKTAYYQEPINQIEIFRTYPLFENRERLLAELAHEAGHGIYGQSGKHSPNEILREIEAYREGRRLAESWGVLNEFQELATNFAQDVLSDSYFEPPFPVDKIEQAKPELNKFLKETLSLPPTPVTPEVTPPVTERVRAEVATVPSPPRGLKRGIPLTTMDKTDFQNWIGNENVVEGRIKVYRGTKGEGYPLRQGDFVTTNKEYAKTYGEHITEHNIATEELNYFSGVKGGDPKLMGTTLGGAQPTELIYTGKEVIPPVTPEVKPTPEEIEGEIKSGRTLKGMTPEEKAIYEREYKKSREAGIDKWTAIKFARSMAKYEKREPEVAPTPEESE